MTRGTLPRDWRGRCTPFQRRVYEAVLKIPVGQVRTYAGIARAIGRPGAARAVGQALKRNRWAPQIPCHRVVAGRGRLGGYSAPGGSARKRRLLRREGVVGGRLVPGCPEMMSFVSQHPALSARLRRQYGRGALTPRAFVDRVLEPFTRPPAPPPGLLLDGAPYLPSSRRMSPAIARRFRGLARDLIERSVVDPVARRRALAAVDALLGRMEGEAVAGRPMRALADAEVVEMYAELVRVATGVRDPYAGLKRDYNEQALAWLAQLHQVVDRVVDPDGRLRVAINLGIIGNALDFADPTQRARLDTDGFDVAAALPKAKALPYATFDARAAFLEALRAAPAGTVLLLTDNAGEIVFDLPLIRLWLTQGRPVVLAGKSRPCYNDMTADDLKRLCRDHRVRRYLGERRARDQLQVIASGTATIGLDLRRATPALVAAWRRAAVIYAKGQGMVQTLRYARLSRDVFHAVQVKDPAYFHEGAPLRAGDALFLHTRCR